MMKWIMIDPIGGIKMTLIPMVALDNTSNRLWLAALPILPELRFWFIGTIKQLEEEFEQRELYSHDLECSSICIKGIPGVFELSICWLAFLLQSLAECVVTFSGYMEEVRPFMLIWSQWWIDVKISGRIDDLFWVQGKGSGETFYAKYQMAGTENQRLPFLGTWKYHGPLESPAGAETQVHLWSVYPLFLENFDYFDPPHQTINNILCHHLPRWEKRGELESCRFCRRGSRRGAEWR